jgi:hypothetical protein
MKKMLFVAAAFAALVATPALAHDTGKDRSWFGRSATSAFARSGGFFDNRAIGGRSTAVYKDGRMIGADPDPNVRLQIRRDYENQSY